MVFPLWFILQFLDTLVCHAQGLFVQDQDTLLYPCSGSSCSVVRWLIAGEQINTWIARTFVTTLVYCLITSLYSLIGLYYFHPQKPPHFRIPTKSIWHSLLKSHDHYPSMLPHHSPITMNLGWHQIQMHRLLLPITDITDHDRDTKTVTPAYRHIIDYTTYSLTAATLLFP